MLHPTMNQIETIAELANGSRPDSLARRTGNLTQTVVTTAERGTMRIFHVGHSKGVRIPDVPVTEAGYSTDVFYAEVAELAVKLGYMTKIPCKDFNIYSVAPKMLITGRRREILVLIANGLTYEQIGRELELTPETIKTHASNLRADLGALSSPHAVALGFARGIITKDDLR